ncbi:MAG: 4Fe-4S binding protein [Chloroflexota bacterium]
MCEFCTEHGEGKVWYLAMQHYGQELLAQDGRREQVTSFLRDFEASTAKALATLDTWQRLPFVGDLATGIAISRQKKSHFGQVVPIEDVDKVLGLVDSVVRLPCVCRSLTTGRRQVRYCYGLGIDPAGFLDQIPDFGEHLETLTPVEAQAAIHGLDEEGLVHSVWTFGTPFIGGLCNCDHDCVAYRLQVGSGMMQVFFAAEYVAAVDWDRCTGCRQCRSQCPFGAVRYSASQDKCLIDPALCYGCGVCRAACPRGAISLQPRREELHWRRRPAPSLRHRVEVRPCQDARACLACVDACPAGVLGTAPRQLRQQGRPAADWAVVALTPSRCTGCGRCVSACPEGALSVT